MPKSWKNRRQGEDFRSDVVGFPFVGEMPLQRFGGEKSQRRTAPERNQIIEREEMNIIKSLWYNKTQKSQVVELQEMSEHFLCLNYSSICKTVKSTDNIFFSRCTWHSDRFLTCQLIKCSSSFSIIVLNHAKGQKLQSWNCIKLLLCHVCKVHLKAILHYSTQKSFLLLSQCFGVKDIFISFCNFL